MSASSTLNFLSDGFDGPLARRHGASAHAAAGEVAPGPIPVMLSPVQMDAGLANVEPALLQTAPFTDAGDLRRLADVAGNGAWGFAVMQGATMSWLIEGALHYIEANASDRVAVQRARQALEQPFTMVVLTYPPAGRYRCDTYGLESEVGSDPQGDFGDRLAQLEEGAHLLLRVSQQVPDNGHALAISATRLPGGQVQMSVFNPHGWGSISETLSERDPAIGKIMQLEDACATLSSLHGGVDLPNSMRRKGDDWLNPSIGLPLAVWLSTAGPEPDLESTGRQMTPQKHADCGIEVEFAWLANVLPEADYKLAKAHALNMLLHAPAPYGVDERVLQRLRERVTSSLSGHSVAAAS